MLVSWRAKMCASWVLGLAFTACTSVQQPEGQRLDTDLSHWQNVYDYGEATLVDDGIALMSTGNFFYLSKQQYADFELELDVKMPESDEYSNSGVIFRADIVEHDGKRSAAGYQAEVDPSKRRWSGGLYEQGTSRQWLHPVHPKRSKPGDAFISNLSPEWGEDKLSAYKHLQWNHYKIRAVGTEITVWVNDVLTTHVIDNKLSRGYIGIQHHGSQAFKDKGDRHNTVFFKNIVITEL